MSPIRDDMSMSVVNFYQGVKGLLLFGSSVGGVDSPDMFFYNVNANTEGTYLTMSSYVDTTKETKLS